MRNFIVLIVAWMIPSVFAGECYVTRVPADRAKGAEMLIIAKKIAIGPTDPERRFISNDNHVVLVLRRVETQSHAELPAAAAIRADLLVDGKEVLVSEGLSDGNSLATRASVVAADGSALGVICYAKDL